LKRIENNSTACYGVDAQSLKDLSQEKKEGKRLMAVIIE